MAKFTITGVVTIQCSTPLGIQKKCTSLSKAALKKYGNDFGDTGLLSIVDKEISISLKDGSSVELKVVKNGKSK